MWHPLYDLLTLSTTLGLIRLHGSELNFRTVYTSDLLHLHGFSFVSTSFQSCSRYFREQISFFSSTWLPPSFLLLWKTPNFGLQKSTSNSLNVAPYVVPFASPSTDGYRYWILLLLVQYFLLTVPIPHSLMTYFVNSYLWHWSWLILLKLHWWHVFFAWIFITILFVTRLSLTRFPLPSRSITLRQNLMLQHVFAHVRTPCKDLVTQ